MSRLFSIIITILMMLESFPVFWIPTLNIDASKELAPVSTRATGFLYGLAEEGVPSKAMTDSLDISSVSQKVVDGLQHPTGDITHVACQLDSCDYTVVYLQDAYSTWYYCHDEIMQMRQNGTYDWEKFITESYFPIIREKVATLKSVSYKDKLVYCIYNECDNGVWFGNYVDSTPVYDEIGRENFYKAWKMTYDLVKSLDSEALIGGPGFCDYETSKIEGFMTYCKQNDCLPDIMIYHELAWWSIYDWQVHVDDYRRIEDTLGIDELDIVVTEYGEMQDCGNPAKMVHYVTAIENSGTWGEMAYWRLANNLNDTAADDNSPNSNWWLYRKYAEMEGNLLKTSVTSVKKKDLYDDDWRLTYKGIASINEEKDEIKVIAAGSENKRAVKITQLDKTQLSSDVNVKIECVYYQGLGGVVCSPIVLRQFNTAVSLGTLNINIPATDTDAVYFITVSQKKDDAAIIKNDNIPVRYEFEDGKLLGSAYKYDSAYATTGKQEGMCGGFENDGDGVSLDVYAKTDGIYDFKVIFGNSNDGKNKDDRDYTKLKLSVDGNEQILSVPNTVKSEYTDCLNLQLELSKGKHEITFSHYEGTFVLDSAIMSLHEQQQEITLLADSDDGTAYLAVAPSDGYYSISATSSASGSVDGSKCSFADGQMIYLRRGLNQIKLDEKNVKIALCKQSEFDSGITVTADEMELSGSAVLGEDKYGKSYIDGISSQGGKAEFSVNVPKDGAYRATVSYANNQEGGYHAYNVDLIEAMLTVETGGDAQNIFCRNTYSLYTYKTLTFDLELKQGENTVSLYNDGSVLFAGNESFAPRIESITISAVNG